MDFRPASELEAFQYLRALVMGPVREGKSCSVILTAPGPVAVLNGDNKNSLKSVIKRARLLGIPDSHFSYLDVRDSLSMERALKAAHAGVRAGRFRTVVLDTVSGYARRLLNEMMRQSRKREGAGEDGRRAYPETQKRIHNIWDRMDGWPCHVVWISHYDDEFGPSLDGQLAKFGPGIVPLLPGKLRKSLPAEIQDIVYFEKRLVKKDGKRVVRRVFHTSMEGVWGPGCRSLAKNDPSYRVVPADIGKLIELFKTAEKSEGAKSAVSIKKKEKKHG